MSDTAVKSTHTPGPWTVTDNFGEGKRLHMVWGGGKLVTRTCYEATSEANAHLIAAAPDMYAVLKKAMEQSEALEAKGVRRSPELMPIYKLALAAIAKAEGCA